MKWPSSCCTSTQIRLNVSLFSKLKRMSENGAYGDGSTPLGHFCRGCAHRRIEGGGEHQITAGSAGGSNA
jgi:hypothetical protein